jgi:hypothetical protein
MILTPTLCLGVENIHAKHKDPSFIITQSIMAKSMDMTHFDLESRSKSTKSFAAKKHGPSNIIIKLHLNLYGSSSGIVLMPPKSMELIHF